VLRAVGVVAIASGALLIAGALPAFASPGLSASGTGTVISQTSPLFNPPFNQPEGVAVVNGTSYVTNPSDHAVDMYSSASPFVSSISLSGSSPFPYAIVASPDGSHLYVTDNNVAGSVFDISTATNTLVNTFPVVGSPIAITVSPDGATFYVISNSDSLIYSYATSDGTFHGQSLPDGRYETAFYVMASPDGTKLYETMRDPMPPMTSGGLRVLSTVGLVEIGHADLPNASGLGQSPDGSRIWVGSTDAASQSVIAEFNPDGSFSGNSVPVSTRPESFIVSHDGNWIYSVSRSTGLLDVVDTSALTDTATSLVAGDGNGIALSDDGLRLYSTNSLAGMVNVMSIAKLTLTSPATVASGATSTTFTAQITDGTSPIADYTTNTVTFDVLNASNTVVATGTVSPDAAGAASASLDLSTLPAASYSVRATLDPIAGSVVVTAAGLTVSAPTLAATGTDTTIPMVVSALLLVGGAMALVVARRRRRV
jgi:LPXTG-motif cell wall-anchored protein